MASFIANELAKCTEKLIVEHVILWTSLPLDRTQLTANLLRLNIFLDEFRNNAPKDFAEWLLCVSVLGEWARENNSDELMSSLVFSVLQMGDMVCKGLPFESLSAMKKQDDDFLRITSEEYEKRVSLVKAVPANENDLVSLFSNPKLWNDDGMARRRAIRAGGAVEAEGNSNGDLSRMDVDDADQVQERGPIVQELGELQTIEEKYGLPIQELHQLMVKPTRLQDMEIGTGRYGVVHKVRLDGMEVAAKKFKKSTDKDFMREVYVCARLRHPGIVTFRGYCLLGPTKLLLMDCMLYSFGSHFPENSVALRKVPINVRVRWALQYASAIEFMHNNSIVHRDINTRNMLISPDHVIKVCDFTYALAWECRNTTTKRLKVQRLPSEPIYRETHPVEGALIENRCIYSCTPTTINEQPRFVGTARYLAPEVASHFCTDYEAADVWSLAMTVLEVLSGIKPLTHLSKDDQLREVTKGLLAEYLARPESDFETVATNAIHRGHFLADTRLEASNIHGLPEDEKEIDALLNTLTFCLAFEPTYRPSASEVVNALDKVDGLFRSLRYQRSRAEAHQTLLPTLAAWPDHFATFPMPTLATFYAPSVGRTTK